jgi:hypothetical protein
VVRILSQKEVVGCGVGGNEQRCSLINMHWHQGKSQLGLSSGNSPVLAPLSITAAQLASEDPMTDLYKAIYPFEEFRCSTSNFLPSSSSSTCAAGSFSDDSKSL